MIAIQYKHFTRLVIMKHLLPTNLHSTIQNIFFVIIYTLFRSMSMFCGTNNIPQNISHIIPTFDLHNAKTLQHFVILMNEKTPLNPWKLHNK